MKIRCPSCSQQIKSTDINLQSMVGLCRSCDDIFAIELASSSTESSYVLKPSAAINLVDDGQKISFRRRWMRPAGGLLFALGGLNLYSLIWAVSRGLGSMGFVTTMAALTAACAYVGAAFLFNRYAIVLDGDSVRSQYGPLPLLREKRVYRSAVKQLYVHEREAGQFDLYIQESVGHTVCLFKGLRDARLASYIACRIEQLLGITHQPVPGEFVAAPHELGRLVIEPGQGLLHLAADGKSDDD
ncbi:MAG: hypothetical protein VYA30_16435 [Myxococcota bacterium]|nr:hypothetical protein [Myxococcota bacterium]